MSKLMSKGWMSDFLSTNTKQSRIPPIHVGWGDLKDGKLLTTFTHLPSHIYVDRPIQIDSLLNEESNLKLYRAIHVNM